MKRKKIVWSALLATALSVATAMPCMAANLSNSSEEGPLLIVEQSDNGANTTVEYSINDLSYSIVDENGIEIESGSLSDFWARGYDVSKATVGVNKTVYWYPSNNSSGFKSGNNVAISISLKTSAATSLTIGITDGTSKEVTDKNPSVSLVSGTAGYWKMYVTNTSSKSIDVTGGTVSWNE